MDIVTRAKPKLKVIYLLIAGRRCAFPAYELGHLSPLSVKKSLLADTESYTLQS